MCDTIPKSDYPERLTESILSDMHGRLSSGWRLKADFDRLIEEVRYFLLVKSVNSNIIMCYLNIYPPEKEGGLPIIRRYATEEEAHKSKFDGCLKTIKVRA